MNNKEEKKIFIVRFKDKSVWNEFKNDLKVTLNEHDIKYQYSEKTPVFYILYKSDKISIRVTWEDEVLTFMLQVNQFLDSEKLEACKEIFDLLKLFSGELIQGSSPYEW